MAASVSSIDIFEDFVATARRRLVNDGVSNVELRCMDATKDLPAGDFDVVIVTASMPALDGRLVDKLAPDGRLFVVIGESPVMTATLLRRGEQDGTTAEELFETDIPPLVAAAEAPVFSF